MVLDLVRVLVFLLLERVSWFLMVAQDFLEDRACTVTVEFAVRSPGFLGEVGTRWLGAFCLSMVAEDALENGIRPGWWQVPPSWRSLVVDGSWTSGAVFLCDGSSRTDSFYGCVPT